MSRIEKLLKAIINNTTYDEPRLSRIEEIFYSILNSLPYNANAQSRIEALLLALKESGLYDERTLSRIEEILKCKLDGRTYTGWIGSRVEMLLNEWELSEIIETTFTSFPIIIKANGEPLLDYTIYGNMSQTGTPTPDNPIQPQETGERTGNLFDKGLLVDAKGIFIDGSVVGDPNRTCTVNAISVSDSSYVLSWVSDNVLAITATYNNGNLVNRVAGLTSPTVIDTTGATELRVVFYKTNVQITKNDVSNVMLNSGSTALPYEPYGYRIPISSANTTTPVYLGEVQSTRKIKKLVLTGNEKWINDNIQRGDTFLYHFGLTDVVGIGQTVGDDMFCTQFLMGSVYGTSMIGFQHTAKNIYFRYTQATLENWRQWLAAQYANGTPVIIWYVLATETTGIVNEPLRKIGDYADTLSMEQAGAEIPTLNKPSNTVIDVETTLKPSKMYVKYNGEGKRVYITADGKLYITSNNEIYILKR